MNQETHKSFVLCLGTEKGLAVARSLRKLSSTAKFTICTFKEHNVSECFEEKIRLEASNLGFTHFNYPTWKNSSSEIISKINADMIICVGWRYLIPPETQNLVSGNVVVAHDSLLPKYRGFSPLPTALMCGEREAGVSFIRATTGVDQGPIYWQRSFSIEPGESIFQLIQKTLPLYVEGVRSAVFGEFQDPTPQDEAEATYSIWRDDLDYLIDWEQSATSIERMIRAVGTPYLGAKTRFGDQTITIHTATVEDDLTFMIRQPGKVWSNDELGRPTVLCGAGMLKIHSATFSDGKSLIPLNRLRVRFY